MAFTDSSTFSGSPWGTTILAPGQASVIKQTYLLLSLSIASALAGGYLGASSPLLVGLFSSWLGWILALVVLNVVPRIALAARNSGSLGVVALVADGFLSGLVLAPILYVASLYAPNMLLAALLITAFVFTTVTLYVLTTNRTFSAPRGLMTGIFVSLLGAMVLNGFLHIGLLGVLISAGIGIFGVITLVYATSSVLRSPEADSPVPGALMLFAGLFNVFVSTLNLLLRFGSSRD